MFVSIVQNFIAGCLCCFQEKIILMTMCTGVADVSLIEVCTTNSNMSPRLIVLCTDFTNMSPIALCLNAPYIALMLLIQMKDINY